MPNETSAILLAGSKGLTVNFSPKAIELYASSMSIDGFHGGFDLVDLEMDSHGIAHMLQNSNVDWSVEDVLIEEVMSPKLFREKSKVFDAVI